MFTDVSCIEFNFVVDAGHSDHTHADQREVVGVGGDQTHLWKGIKKRGKECFYSFIGVLTAHLTLWWQY